MKSAALTTAKAKRLKLANLIYRCEHPVKGAHCQTKMQHRILLTSATGTAFVDMRRKLFSGILVLLFLAAVGCGEKKQIAAARANAVGFGLARCECEKLSKKEPPGDTKLCSQQMAQALRYLNINFEMGKFSEAEKQAMQKAADAAFEKCMQE